MTKYIVGAAAAVVLIVAGVVLAAPGENVTGDGIIETSVDGHDIAPASVTATGTVQGADLVSTDDCTVGDDLAVTGLCTIGETLAVTGNATVGGTLDVTGALSGEALTCTTAHATGAVTFDDALTVTGAASFGGSTTTGTNSEAHACAWHSTTLTFAANPGDASKTATGLIPAGSVLHAIATRVLVTGTNCATVDIGDGVDADLFGNDIAVAAGTTTNDASWTAQVMNPQLTAGDVVITGNVNCFDYSARVSAFYCTTTAPAD